MSATSNGEYPLTLKGAPLLGEDRAFHHRWLMDDASRLFKEELDIGVLLMSKEDGK